MSTEPGNSRTPRSRVLCATQSSAPRPAHVARLENRPFRHGLGDAAPTIVRTIASAARTRRVKAEPAAHTEPELSTGDIGRRAASGVVLLTGKGIFAQALGLLSTIVVTRLLLPSQLGLFAIAVTISSFLWMLSGGLGMASALIRRPTAPEHADLRAYVALQLGVTSILVVAVALATLPFGLVGQLTALMVATAPLGAFRGASAVSLERQLLYKRLATAETAEVMVYYAWTIVTVAIGWGVWGLATAVVARAVVGTAVTVALSPIGIVWPGYDRRRIRAILGIGMRVQAVDFVVAVRDQILVLGTTVVGSVSIVAYWSVVLRALQAPGMLLWVCCACPSRPCLGPGPPAETRSACCHASWRPQQSSPGRCSPR